MSQSVKTFLMFLFVMANAGAILAQNCECPPVNTDSPRIRQLAADIQSGDKEAANRFWDEMKGRVPLVEFIPPHNEGYMWVTFLWHGGENTKKVTLNGGPPASSGTEKPLGRLAQSDVWFRTERLPMDARFNYSFMVTEQIPGTKQSKTEELTDPFNSKTFEGDSVMEMVLAPLQPWIERLPGAP